ncbi:MAG: diaminopimelate decarboxylase [Candidatus Wallbacteria bacterium HGW-Wallbacteria-1]|jgi:diaminopimelate decarboxylase|uniref:Diaminopimelate decarboxylase n=1 Tax=Candidatus Wallbacteria bacterium HGW-Wallbacteria-1 TaxID=2013854 RepID=A0A2N1PLA7_9BACT|nr:MAG: diaminopimelate decarboxylase [Candidatus Wallbacteria bacterium HGW-Wallbacteria-1]
MSNTHKAYEKPNISRIETKLAGKAGMTSPEFSQKIRTEIDGVSIDELISRFGSPLFVISEKDIRDRYKLAYEAFSERYPRFRFAWSYKTNYLKSVCALFHNLGSLAEVVSSFEYDKARNLGVPGHGIIFNGPYKPMEVLEKAALEDAMIHIDSFDEINDLEKVSRKLDKELSVAIRVNMDTGIYPHWSRFGFNLDNGQALDALKRIRAGKRLRVVGLHTHIGTFILDPGAYGRAVDKLMVLAAEIRKYWDEPLRYIDLGGGFPSLNRLKGIYQPPEVVIPPVEAYADAICGAMLRNISEEPYPELILETGRFLIDQAGSLITSVVSARNLVNGQRGYVLDAGVNLLYTSTWYNFNVETDRRGKGIFEPSALLGPLCMNIDVVEESIMLPRLEKGTRVILSPVGAYNITQSMQFIHCRPATVMIRTSGATDLIRRRETLEDMEAREALPEDLKAFNDTNDFSGPGNQ